MQQSPTSPDPVAKPVSDPDLYYAKCIYEDRIKNALQYNLEYQSPLAFMDQFFKYTFSAAQLREAPISQWMSDCKQTIVNLTFIPLTLWFHPVLVAAAFLAWSRQNLIARQPAGTKPQLPETLHGHAWYLYVDSGISQSQLQALTEVLDSEINFISNLFASPPQAEKIESPVSESETSCRIASSE